MPRRVGIEIFGDEKDLLKAFKNSERAARQFNSEMTHLGHRGREVFHSFGRSLAFATGGFVAVHSVTEFLSESVDAAREAQKAQASLAAQMKASGESFEANREQIEKTAVSYGRFGFENDEVIQSLTVLERATGDIQKAQRLQLLVADLARARNMRLAAAAGAVAKAYSGQDTALRRAVPGLDANAHGVELLRLAQQKLAGQAAANTTQAEKFHATLHDTQEIIGNALLPTLDQYLGRLGDWLQKQNESGDLQRNLNTTMQAAIGITTTLADAVTTLAGAYRELNDVRGKTKDEFGKLGFLFGSAGNVLRGATGEGRFSLKKALRVLTHPGGGPLDFSDFPGARGNLKPDLPATIAGAVNVQHVARQARTVRVRDLSTLVGQRNQWFDARIARQLDRVQDLSLRRQPLRLKQIAQEIRARLAVTKDATRRLTLEDDLIDVLRRQKAVEGEITDQKNQQLKAAKDKRAEEKQAAKEALQAAQRLADQIKSATIDRLQRQQQGRENQRAIADAAEQLRATRRIGGPVGIREATRALADARFAQRIFGLEAQPATLRRGQFGFAGITVNIHGVTDPDQVAKQVIAAIERRGRHTTVTSRGPAAGTRGANR